MYDHGPGPDAFALVVTTMRQLDAVVWQLCYFFLFSQKGENCSLSQ
jgi:hypothetical protein